jgi:hypothetical protein
VSARAHPASQQQHHLILQGLYLDVVQPLAQANMCASASIIEIFAGPRCAWAVGQCKPVRQDVQYTLAGPVLSCWTVCGDIRGISCHQQATTEEQQAPTGPPHPG